MLTKILHQLISNVANIQKNYLSATIIEKIFVLMRFFCLFLTICIHYEDLGNKCKIKANIRK